MIKQTPHERILQLRIIVALHSYIYYEMCDSSVSDHTWQSWANELAELQRNYPEYTDDYDKWFIDWDGTTGFLLCDIPGLHESALRFLTVYDGKK